MLTHEKQFLIARWENRRNKWDRSHDQTIQALRDLPDEKVIQPLTFPWGEFGTVAYLVEVFVDHEEEHAAHLRQWLENPGQTVSENH